jgi:hypothetical protein
MEKEVVLALLGPEVPVVVDLMGGVKRTTRVASMTGRRRPSARPT